VGLFDSLGKDRDFDASLDRFNSTLKSIPYTTSVNAGDADQNAIDTILSAAESADKGEFDTDQLSSLFNDLEIPKDKLERYKTYESIYNTVQIAKRAITVYMNNTFLRNAVSNKHYSLHPVANVDPEKTSDAIAFAESFIEKHNLIPLLKRTAKDSLIFGDGYLEFVDLEEVKIGLSSSKKDKNGNPIKSINESRVISRLTEDAKKSRVDISINDQMLIAEQLLDFDEPTEESTSSIQSIMEDAKASDGDETDDSTIMNRFMLRYHSPDRITEIESDHGMSLGYIQVSVEENTKNTPTTTNTVQQFMKSIEFAGGYTSKKVKKKGLTVKTDEFVDVLVRTILGKNITTKKKNATLRDIVDDATLEKLKPDLKWAIKKIMVATGNSSISDKRIKVRYIAPQNIFQTTYTNGTSVIDTMAYPSKQYLLMQLTNMLSRLSKAASIRKWTLDIGSRENASTVVRRLKEELRNQRITASDMTTKDVSKLITDFKDLITVTKNGKAYVDVNVENMGDPSQSTGDLEFQRNEIIAVSGIPASYLGYTDSYELRDQLVHANISFANEVMAVQSEVNTNILRILDKAAIAVDREPISKYVSVSLTAPMVLMLQVMETVMTSFSTIYANISDTMQLPTDPVALLEQFVPYANWKEIVKQGESYKTIKKMVGGDSQDSGGGFG